MNNCPKCGNPIQAGASSCPICGTQFTYQQNIANVQTSNQNTNQNISIQPQQSINQNTLQQPNTINNQAIQFSTSAQQTTIPQSTNVQIQNKKEKKKSKVNFKVILIFLVIVIAIIVAFLLLNSPKATKKTVTNNEDFEYTEASAGGFKFKMVKDWYALEGNGSVLVKDSKSNLLIKLEIHKKSFDDYSKEKIENYIKTYRSDAKDIVVSEKSIESKSTYMVEAKVKENDGTENLVQYYYVKINDGTIVGATVIYLDESIKEDVNKAIETLIGSISYSNDTVTVVKDISEHTNAFGIYGNTLSSANN